MKTAISYLAILAFIGAFTALLFSVNVVAGIAMCILLMGVLFS